MFACVMQNRIKEEYPFRRIFRLNGKFSPSNFVVGNKNCFKNYLLDLFDHLDNHMMVMIPLVVVNGLKCKWSHFVHEIICNYAHNSRLTYFILWYYYYLVIE